MGHFNVCTSSEGLQMACSFAFDGLAQHQRMADWTNEENDYKIIDVLPSTNGERRGLWEFIAFIHTSYTYICICVMCMFIMHNCNWHTDSGKGSIRLLQFHISLHNEDGRMTRGRVEKTLLTYSICILFNEQWSLHSLTHIHRYTQPLCDNGTQFSFIQ